MQQYFADGMTEALISDLSAIDKLRVISRTSVMQFKETTRSLAEIADALRVDAIIEGAVLQTATRVRITARLIDARTHISCGAASTRNRSATRSISSVRSRRLSGGRFAAS